MKAEVVFSSANDKQNVTEDVIFFRAFFPPKDKLYNWNMWTLLKVSVYLAWMYLSLLLCWYYFCHVTCVFMRSPVHRQVLFLRLQLLGLPHPICGGHLNILEQISNLLCPYLSSFAVPVPDKLFQWKHFLSISFNLQNEKESQLFNKIKLVYYIVKFSGCKERNCDVPGSCR